MYVCNGKVARIGRDENRARLFARSDSPRAELPTFNRGEGASKL